MSLYLLLIFLALSAVAYYFYRRHIHRHHVGKDDRKHENQHYIFKL